MKPVKSELQETPTICRGFTIIFSLVIMAAALAGVAIVSYSWIKTQDVWKGFGTFGTLIFALVITVLSVLVLTMLMALCGTIRRDRCCIIFSVVLMVFWALFFIGIGVATLVAIPKFFDANDNSKCTSLDPFVAMQNSAVEANNTICQTCACYFPNRFNGSVYSADCNSLIELEMAQLAVTASAADQLDSTLPVRLQDCSNLQLSHTLSGNLNLFKVLEDRYKCTGWCSETSSLFYKFSNVNNGKPQYTCYARISERLNYYGKYAAIISFIIGGLVALGWLTSVWYLCNSGKRPAPAQAIPPTTATTHRRQMHVVPSSSHASLQDPHRHQ